MAGTAREAVDRLREAGVLAGLLRLRLFRPFPAAEIATALAGAGRVAVVDRNCSIGSGGIFCQEVRAALSALGQGGNPVLSYIAGLGGVNVSPERMMQIARDALGREGTNPEPIQAEGL